MSYHRREWHCSQLFRPAGDVACKPPEDTPTKHRREMYSEVARMLPGAVEDALARCPKLDKLSRAIENVAEKLAGVPVHGHAPGTVLTFLTLTHNCLTPEYKHALV